MVTTACTTSTCARRTYLTNAARARKRRRKTSARSHRLRCAARRGVASPGRGAGRSDSACPRVTSSAKPVAPSSSVREKNLNRARRRDHVEVRTTRQQYTATHQVHRTHMFTGRQVTTRGTRTTGRAHQVRMRRTRNSHVPEGRSRTWRRRDTRRNHVTCV